ncbi:phosphohistidine phosphatase SixA [Puniceicoccaceae bacterium K14]|nr:phosphohistidine phosphatase SixA [Puniceicoccaceae bacterium K14]
MEQRIYIARHAHAEEGSPDESRTLSSKGFKQMGRLCKYLANNDMVKVDEIWQSGLVRATETAQCLHDGLVLDAPTKTVENLSPFDNPSSVVEAIDSTSNSILIVGHEPNLSALYSLLVSGKIDEQKIVFNKASILALSRLRAGDQKTKWEIQWHVWHKLFKS